MHISVRLFAGLILGGCGECDAPSAAAKPTPTEGWVAVAGGSFTMGSPADEPCRDADEAPRPARVEAFLLHRYEVTQAAFEAATGSNPSFHQCAACPVDSVTRVEASAFCAKLGGRLPTEAEHEYATRAGTETAFSDGEIASCMARDPVASELAWYKANSGGFTHPVGKKAANPFGLFDLNGNVYEWTSSDDAAGRAILRGGSWFHNAEHARSANRMTVPADKRLSYAGFRCAREQSK